jgi:quinol monooxygenase YgiN
MSHSVMIHLNCNKGAGPEFLSVLLPSLAETRAYNGCELVETYVDSDDPDRIVLWERWAARSNQEAYMHWRVETGMVEAVGGFLAEPPSVMHLSAAD